MKGDHLSQVETVCSLLLVQGATGACPAASGDASNPVESKAKAALMLKCHAMQLLPGF